MAYLFSQLINVFTLISPTTMDEFEQQSAFWSLMWTILAIVTGFAYFVLGFVSTHVAHYISSKYRQQYFEGLLYQKTSFFDQEENSTGTLTARVGSDPKQLEELLGMNMAMVYTSFFTLIGSLAIAFAFGWKLALVATAVTAPIGLVAGYFRLSYELEFEKLYAVVFAESSQFAAESISAFRTVTSLTLEDTICTRYDHLLNGHVGKAFKKARWSTFIFAFSDSVSFACQALIFWYGSRLMATREYNVMQFFVCFMAVIQGAEGAGQGFSFGPNAAQASAAANRILSVRESRHKRMDDVSEKKQQQHIPDTEGGVKIELQDVHFKYPTRDTPIFRGLDLTIEKGQFAALVGASGCGKTSIVSLLERFYDIQRGAIFANGVDITDIDVYKYRKYLSLVAQEPTRKFTHTPSLAPPPFFLRDERCGQSALVPTHRIRIRTPGARCFFTYLPTYLPHKQKDTPANTRYHYSIPRHSPREHPPRGPAGIDPGRGAPRRVPGRGDPRLHRVAPGRVRDADREPRGVAVGGAEAAGGDRAGAGPAARRPAPRRGHQQPGLGERAARAAGVRARRRRPHHGRRRAPPRHRPERRRHLRAGRGRQGPRAGEPRGLVEAEGRLLEYG